MKLSIIIPMYNVGRYIEKCMLSVIKQHDCADLDYEVIVVNDGSPDNSLAIAERIADKHDNIKIITKENGGLSSARNKGLELAQGEYVWFIDSDDWIEPGSLKEIANYLANGVDLVQLRYQLAYEDSDIKTPDFQAGWEGEATSQDLCRWKRIPQPAQFTIYRHQFLLDNNLQFVKGIYHEDAEFKPRAVYHSKNAVFCPYIAYNYLQRTKGSIMSNFNIRNAHDTIFVMNSLQNFINEHKLDGVYKEYFCYQIGVGMNSLLFEYRKLSKEDQRVIRREFKQNKHLFSCMLNSGNIKYMLEGVLCSINVNLGLFLHSLLR